MNITKNLSSTNLVALIVLVDAIGFSLIVPIFPIFASTELKASPLQITSVASVYFLAAFITSPLLGKLSDKLGRKPVLLFSQLGTLANYLIISVAPNIWYVYAARALDGITAGNFAIAQAYISDITPQDHTRTKELGKVSLALALSLVIGPIIGGMLMPILGPRLAYASNGVFVLLAILITIFFLKEDISFRLLSDKKAKSSQSIFSLMKQGQVFIILAIYFLSQFSFYAYQSVFVLWAHSVVLNTYTPARATEIVAYSLAWVGAWGVLVQIYVLNFFVTKFGALNIMIVGVLSRVVGFTILAAWNNEICLFLAMPFLAIGTGLIIPSTISILTFFVDRDQNGEIIGLSQAFSFLGSLLGPLTAGILFQLVNPQSAMLMIVAISFVSLLVSLSILRTKDRASMKIF